MANNFCSLLKSAIKDEEKAPKDYEKLKIELGKVMDSYEQPPYGEPSPNPIDEIISDEYNHADILKELKSQFC